jgi:hypothetical protein
MLHRVVLVGTDVPEEHIEFIIKVTKIDELETLAITNLKHVSVASYC